MLVKLDDEILFEIDDTMIKLLAHDLLDPISEIKRRLQYIIDHKCDQCYERLEKEYLDVLRQDDSVKSIPKSKKDFVDLVVLRQDYKNRRQREEI